MSITLSLPRQWVNWAVRRVVRAAQTRPASLANRPLWQRAYVWASISHILSLVVLSKALPSHDWGVSFVAVASFLAVSRMQDRVNR